LVSKEGRVSSRHFIHKNTKGPPVDSFVVTLKYEIKKMVNKVMKQQVYIELEYEVGCSKINKHSHALASIQFQQIISLK
jgi:hypothetical protein